MEENQQKLRKAVSDVSQEIGKYYTLEVERKFDDIEEVEEAECQCCGLKDECSRVYMREIEEDHCGKWLCGLCCEAVKERVRQNCKVTMEDALDYHKDFCQEYNATIRLNPKLSITLSMREIAKRSLEKRKFKLSRSISYP
ncbi:hypothetical protein P8452_29311 [Trifolium repens]|nr:hypothetical protein P8452_29311 [Trifolium repens]